MNKIAVLLAVYNGREWIDEQINSILNQEGVNLDIYVSVDVSSDSSYEYLLEKYSHYSNVFLLPYGNRFGSAGKNFYRLLQDSPLENYDYISFSDQDDIWTYNKLKHAINSLKSKNVEAYSSNVIAFWEDGRQVLINKAQAQGKYDYIFEAAGPGCTYVFSKKLAIHFKEFLTNNLDVQNIALHDWILYAFARRNGYSWWIDNDSWMMYRQHSNNQVGANNSIAAAIKRFTLAKKGWYKNEVYKISHELNLDNLRVIKELKKNNFSRLLYLFSNIKELRRRNRDRIVLIVFFLLRWI
ncbi:alpha-L-Rha alpha-1,3-L-rhamnosyltransferase [Buttiauxella brennerae ATCC 51605]|uniref:Alpha-L-Rha alpha-1,3-L-rhamnosyltransferase n=1 Tax=Buttiauxella brennerae ATCC 51605 TaxID=1354251 RepID=A0A1B7INV1_9ENTR|nr:glycosyltransferase [Buttiauxella brennerae]OAT31374.1 alpha-L-Rha alpha-1,3-L-rhamnosyltransferase [Buttiauxella brennerae ATCC 51605]